MPRKSLSTTLRKSRGAKRSVGVKDVGLAPADELLAGFDGEFAARVGGAEAADGERRAAAACGPTRIRPEIALGFLVRVGARVDGRRRSAGWVELVEGLVAEERFADDVRAVVGRGLRERPGAVVSRKPRWVKFCARRRLTAASSRQSSQRTSVSLLAPQGLHGEIVILHRDVVFQLFHAQDGAAVAAEIGHLQAARSPDALDIVNVLLWRRRTSWSLMKFSYCAGT